MDIKTSCGSYSFVYTVIGSTEEVDAWYAKLCEEYHPCGYGTHIINKETLPDYRVKIVASHAHSCD